MKNTKKILLSLIVLGWTVAAMAQVPTTTHPAISGKCNTETVTLTADYTGDFYVWSKDGVTIPDTTRTITVPLNEVASYSCIVRDIAPVVSANMMGNGSFEEDNTSKWYNKSGTYQPFNSDYNYFSSDGWDPAPGFYNRHAGANGLYVITKNAHKMWRNLLDIAADDGQYYAYFDAANAGDAWKASTAENPGLKTIKDSVYVFSFSAVNINKHMSGAGVVDVTPPTAADLEYLKKAGKYVVAVRLPNTCNDVIWTNNPTNTSAWYYFQELPGFNGWYYTLLPTSVTTGNIYQLKDDGTYQSNYNIPLQNYTVVSGSVDSYIPYNKVIFRNDPDWATPYVYIWDENGGEKIAGNWPGTAAVNKGGNMWEYTIPEGKTPTSSWKIIWSNNGAPQTANLNYEDGATYNNSGIITSPTQPTSLTITSTANPIVLFATTWNQWPCPGDFNSIDSHPAKLQFTISNGSETINLGEPIDLDCSTGEPMHTWQRRELTWKAKWTSSNITIAVKNLTNVAGNGNDFGLDRIMFQMKDVGHSTPKGVSNFSILAATTPSVTFKDQTISSTATTVTAKVTGVANADYPVAATIKLNGKNYTMSITSATASETLTLQSALTTGNYTATVTFKDAKGCSGTSSFKVTVTGKPSVSIDPIADLCLGDTSSITVSFTPSADETQYKYCVKQGSTVKIAETSYASIPASKSFTIDITNWDAGKTYTVYMKVIKGAEESDEVSEEFTINALPSATLTAAAICEKDKKFVLKATGIKENPTYSFVLDGKTYDGTLAATNTINLQSTLTAKTYSNVSVKLTSASGCEKVVKFNLKVNPVYATGAEIESTCQNDAYTWTGHVGTGHKLYIDGKAVTTIPTNVVKTITVVDSMKTVGCGCDSVATLKLTINPSKSSEFTITACDSYTWDGTKYTVSGDYTNYYKTAVTNCDSTVTLHLTINKSYKVDTTAVECNSFTWHGVTYTSTPTEAPTHNYGTKAGCDSIVTLHLTINKSYKVDTTAVECNSFTWHGVTYTSTPTEAPTHNYGTKAGCDSIVTLHLTINKSYKVDTTAVECDSFTWHGVNYTSTPTEAPTHNYGTKAGCDSIVTLYLTVNKSKTSEETVRNCGAYTWAGVEYTISGDYTETLVAANGCDSVATLHLTVLNDSLMYTKWGNLVLCADRNRNLKSYQWYINGAEVPGATGQYFSGDDRLATEVISVRAITQNGDTIYSCEKKFGEITTSVAQSKEEYSNSSKGPVRVYSISGRLIRTEEGSAEDIAARLPAGIYIFRMEERTVRWIVF